MAIVLDRPPPASGPRVVGLALRDLMGRSDPRDMAGGAQISLSQPLPVYRLMLDRIGGPDTFRRAELYGWRYLIETADGAAAYADVRELQSGEAAFASLSRNLNAERLIEAAYVAQRVAAALPSDCDARVLDVPSLYISTIWLNADRPVFIPYIDADRLSKPGVAIDVDPEFVPRLEERARLALQEMPSASEAAP